MDARSSILPLLLSSAVVVGCASSSTPVSPSSALDSIEPPAATVEAEGSETAEMTTTVAETTTMATTTTMVGVTTTNASSPTTDAASTTRAGVEDLPAGWFCRDVSAAGYTYAEAVSYWIREGSPDRMDADRNGIPCETVYRTSDVLAYWGDPLPTTTTLEARRWYGPSGPWAYPPPDSPDGGVYGSGCSPGSEVLPDGEWFGFVVDATPAGIRFDLACLEVPDAGHATVRNESSRLRSVPVADEAVVHRLRMGVEAAVSGSYDEWRSRGCTTGADACAMWIFINDGEVTDAVEVRVYGS